METMMIYPYSKVCEPYVKNSKILGKYKITALVSPRGWGYEGDVIVGRDNTQYMVSSDFSKSLDTCSCVWFVSDDRVEMPRKLLKAKLLEAVNHKKRILYTRYGDNDYKEMKELIPAELYIEKNVIVNASVNLLPDRVYDIETPVAIVAGIGQDTDKLMVQLTLGQKFQEKGYTATIVSSRQDGDWEGVYSMPAFMFDKSVSETEKIIKLNHYVKQIEINDIPDVIIFGVPGAILPYDGIDHNEFGILAYEISFAVPCDAAILCIMYNSQFDGDYSKFAKDMENRFGYKVAGIHIAATVMDVQEYFEEQKMSLVSIDRSIIDKKISELKNESIWNLLNEEEAERAISVLIDILSN